MRDEKRERKKREKFTRDIYSYLCRRRVLSPVALRVSQTKYKSATKTHAATSLSLYRGYSSEWRVLLYITVPFRLLRLAKRSYRSRNSSGSREEERKNPAWPSIIRANLKKKQKQYTPVAMRTRTF